MNCISFRQVSRIYQTPAEPVAAVKNLTLAIPYGEFVAVTGASGSGKTTFLNLAAGLDTPTQGEIWIRGQNIGRLNADQMAVFRRRNIGIVFQDCRLLDVLDVKDNITFSLRADGTVPDEAYIGRICRMLGISRSLNKMPWQLSAGERQRTAIARALAAKPAIILADEPTGSLDRKNGLDVLAMLLEVNRELGQTVVMVTHNMQAAQMAGRIIWIEDGEVKEIEKGC
ncbi:MAG: ABC transporter ATP-binding protein [Eubacterium sp.]|nr:ABC transporter ATP-binding protein [Eubacterium sp.]